MATRLGVAYVELDMDFTPFRKAQATLVNESKVAGKTIEENFKRIGVTSDQMYQAMANRAIKAFEKIGLSHKSSFDEVERSYAATVAKINALNNEMTKNPLYDTLGVKSQASIEAQKTAIITSYQAIKDSGSATAIDLVNIEKAKTAKIIALNNELNAVQLANDKKRLQEFQATTQAEINNQRAKVAETQALAQGQINAQQKVENERARISQLRADDIANQKSIQEGYWTTLGIRSTDAIQKDIEAVKAAAKAKQNLYERSSQDWVNIENAKNTKLKELNKEMVGEHEMSMASMMRAVLRLYAVYYVASSAAQALVKPFIDGFKAVEEYNTSVASLAAMMVTFSDNQENTSLETKWNKALQYSSAMVPVLEQIAAKTILSGQETTALANAFARSGVFLEQNNQTQIKAFTNISNALPLMTQGQEIMRQINTEVRSLMTGANEASSMLLTTLKAINPNIEKDLKVWRAQGTVLEHIGELLKGFGPATAILENQWTAVKSSLETTYNILMRSMMDNMYADINASLKSLNETLTANKEEIIKYTDILIGSFKAIGSAISVYLIAKFIEATPAIYGFIAAQASAVAAMVAAHPVLLAVAVAIGGITMAFQYMSAEADRASRAMNNYVKSVRDMNLSQINVQLKEKEATLKVLEERYKKVSMASSASAKQEIDDTKYLIAVLKSRAKVASDVPDAVQKANNTARNLTKMAEEEARQLHKQTKNEFMKGVEDQVAALRKAGASQIEIDKYTAAQTKLYQEKFGKADSRETLKAAKAAQREEEQILTALTKQNKTYYDTVIQNAKSAAELKIKQGENVLEANTELYNKEQDALNDWYNKQAIYINRSFASEKVKQEKLEALYDEYSKKWDANKNDKLKKEEDYAQKNIAIMAEAYKTINQYSDESINAEIANIERKRRADTGYAQKGSQDEVVLLEASTKKIEDIYSRRDTATLSLYEKTKIYAANATEIIENLAIDEYNKAIDLTNDETVAEKAYTDFVRDESIKRLKISEDENDGIRAYLLERQRDYLTFAQAGYNIIRQEVEGFQNTLSDVLFDGMKGDMKSFQEYWDKFADALLRKFTDTIAQMAVEWALGVNQTGGSGSGFLGLLSGVASLINGGVGIASSLASTASAASSAAYTASAYSSLASSSSSGFAMLYHDGGVVGESSVPMRIMPAMSWSSVPRYHNGLLSDEFPAVLQKGETVLPRGQSASGGSTAISINIVAADAKSFEDMCKRNPGAIINPNTNALQNNRINKQWKGLLQ